MSCVTTKCLQWNQNECFKFSFIHDTVCYDIVLVAIQIKKQGK